jgi:Pyridoxamine 5'-phosphate oxidase
VAIRPWRPGSGQLQDASFGQAGPAVRKAYPPTRQMTASQLAGYLGRSTYALASSTRPDGRAHAAPTLFTLYASAFWLPTIDGAARLGNVRAHPWLALSIIEGEHDTHAAVLTEGPARYCRPPRKTSRALPSPATEPAAWTGQRPGYG